MNKQNKYLKFGLIALSVVLLLSFVSVYGVNSGTMNGGMLSNGMNSMMSGIGNMMGNGMMGEMNECHEAMESGDMGKMQSMMQKHMG